MLQLKELRELTGKRQTTVASELGISRQAYSHYENNRRMPDMATLKRIANYFDVPLDNLFIDSNKEIKFDLQLFSNKPNFKVAELSGEILSMKDDKKIALTVDILNRIKTMSTEQVEALNIFLSKIK